MCDSIRRLEDEDEEEECYYIERILRKKKKAPPRSYRSWPQSQTRINNSSSNKKRRANERADGWTGHGRPAAHNAHWSCTSGQTESPFVSSHGHKNKRPTSLSPLSFFCFSSILSFASFQIRLFFVFLSFFILSLFFSSFQGYLS